MVPTDSALKELLSLPHRVRAAFADSQAIAPFTYADEPFFSDYLAVEKLWAKGGSRRIISEAYGIGRDRLRMVNERFEKCGALGLLPDIGTVEVDPRLERLTVLVKSARPHEHANLVLRLANALEIPGACLDLIRQIQRCHGYGQMLDRDDQTYLKGLQHILDSIVRTKEKLDKDKRRPARERFLDFARDPLQQRLELFRKLSTLTKRRQLRPELRRFGIHPNRYYELRERYMTYGIWGLVDLLQTTKVGEKLSPELELAIIEERLMDSSLSTAKMIEKLQLHCSKSHVQKVFSRWGLSRVKNPVVLRGVKSEAFPKAPVAARMRSKAAISAKARFPDLVKKANLKVDGGFTRLLQRLSYRNVTISNPGAILIAPFLDQLGVVEALNTYGPACLRSSQITNNIIVNTLRIIAGFPTINSFTLNSDRSVALGAGLSLSPCRSRFYDSFDQLRFEHLQKLRNDAAIRARELGLTEAKGIALDYHCDPSDSRFPHDKAFSKAPDKNGDVVYAHRPHLVWDSLKNTIINIAYCEGRSRAPTALYSFCEKNLFKVIDTDALAEIYADSEYTGEKQLIYLMVRTNADITMCLKQNPKIKRWRDEAIKTGAWERYGKDYRIVAKDFVLPETGKPFRFIVKQNLETNEIRCFGSTHADYSATKILDAYHVRWPVETGIKDLVENYFLNHPTGTSPEKVEAHYYCVMLARLAIDYFRSVVCVPGWKKPEDWECVLSTMRTAIFSNQNCELSLDESGDLLVTYLDGDPQNVKAHLARVLQDRKAAGLNKVSWWANRSVGIAVKDQYDFQ